MNINQQARIQAFLDRRAKLRGLDPEVIEAIGDGEGSLLPLNVSDLRALLASQPPQDERSPKCPRHGVYMCVSCMRSRSSAEPVQPVALPTLTDQDIRKIHTDWLVNTGGADSLIGFGRAILAALAPAQQAGQSEPEGWKLVPVEPTDAMAVAGIKAHFAAPSQINGVNYWRAMLDASPTHELATPPQPVAAEVEKDAKQ